MGALAKTVARAEPAQDLSLPIPRGFCLESGDRLADTHISLRRFGNQAGPQIVALGGISAGRDVCGEKGWWRETFNDHGAVDLERFGVLGFDFAPVADQRVRLTPCDQARLIVAALDALEIERLHAFVGASYGGLVGLAFAAEAPKRIERLCVISAAHRQAAQSLALRGVQRRVVEFAIAHGDDEAGLSLARQLAMITYRTGEEFEARFGAGVDAGGQGEVDRYLQARGEAYTRTMTPRRWLTLSEAIDRTDINPAAIRARTTLVASPDDELVPIALMRELAGRIVNVRRLHVIASLFGHDAFLKEPARIAPIIRDCLEEPIDG